MGQMTDNVPVQGVSVGDLVRQRTGDTPDRWELALVQRSAVWDEVRMARLLDSLLLGYPIGGLLVCRVQQGGSVLITGEDGREAHDADATVSQLLDGQQRVNALVSLFSEAGQYGRFFLDMASPPSGGDVVTRRRDKRTVMRYIRWAPDGTFSDESEDGERGRHLELARFAAWARRVGEDDVRAAVTRVASDRAASLAVLREIDPAFELSVDGPALDLVAERTACLLRIWSSASIPVQHLELKDPSDVLQVFTRINLEGVRVSGDDVFFAGVKTSWPEAEQTLHRVQGSLPLVSRMGALRVLARLASIQVGEGDMLPLQIDRLKGDKGRLLVRSMETLVSEGRELARMQAVSEVLTGPMGLGHALRLVDASLLDHVLGWAAVNPQVEEPGWLVGELPNVSAILIGATAYQWPTILRESFSRLAFREALAAGSLGEPFPLERIAAAARRQWSDLKVGQRSVPPGPVDVRGNARLFLSILQGIPFNLPTGRKVEWDHIYPQARASAMRWRGLDGSQRLQHHPLRGLVWQGANLWALDADINLAASDMWPSDKFALLGSLPSGKLPSGWPVEGFLSDQERDALLAAEAGLRKGSRTDSDVDAAMRSFERFVRGRASRIRKEILGRYPSIASFAQDAPPHSDAWPDRPIPPQLIKAALVVTKPGAEPATSADGPLSPDEIRAIAYEFLRGRDPDRSNGAHYYDILHAVAAVGLVAHGDGAPRVHGVLSNAPALFEQLGSGRFTWNPVSSVDRRYWVMRTDRHKRPALWAELQQGRLRQGWGGADDQDLRELRRVALEGGTWTDTQRAAARNRRMLSDEPNSITIGDLIIAPHLPDENRYSLVSVTGPYEYGPSEGWSDYRHVLPVTLLSGPAGIDVNDRRISVALRRSLRNQHRMWNIDPVGPDVEALGATLEGAPAP